MVSSSSFDFTVSPIKLLIKEIAARLHPSHIVLNRSVFGLSPFFRDMFAMESQSKYDRDCLRLIWIK